MVNDRYRYLYDVCHCPTNKVIIYLRLGCVENIVLRRISIGISTLNTIISHFRENFEYFWHDNIVVNAKKQNKNSRTSPRFRYSFCSSHTNTHTHTRITSKNLFFANERTNVVNGMQIAFCKVLKNKEFKFAVIELVSPNSI